MNSKLINQVSLTLACTSLGISAVVTAPGMAQEPLLEFHSVGLYDWPANAKDQKVMDAFKLMRDRIGDLVLEMDMDPMQGEMMQMGWDLLTARSSLYFGPDENGMNASFVLTPGNGNPEAMQQQLSGLAMMGGMEFVDQGDQTAEAMGPMGPMTLGYDKNRLWITMGDAEPTQMDIKRYGLPEDVTPLMSGRIDINGMLNMFAPEMVEQMQSSPEMMMGNPLGMFMGPDAAIVEFSAGVDAMQTHMMSRLIGARQAMQQSEMSTPALFGADDLRSVPQDAVRLSAMQTNMGMALQSIEQALAMSGENPLEEINAQLGVDLIDDVLANIGDRAMYYQSMSTGGGGLTSAVVLLELRDANQMARAHRTLVNKLNELAEEEIDGYVKVQNRQVGGVEVFTMNVPGLPIPFEPSWAINQGHLVITMSPASIEAALAQMSPRANQSLLDNAQFKAAIVSRMPGEGAAAINFMDTPRMVAKGYGMTNLLTSAIANMARSPEHPERVQGSLMPGYTTFVSNVQSSGSISKWDGDDLVTHHFGDRSMLVQLSAGLGTLADVQGLIVPAVGVGVMLPALEKARERANQLKSATQVRSLIQALIVYGAGNGGNPPSSMQDLIDDGFIMPDLLVSPMGSAFDGGPDYTVRLTKQAVDSYNAQYIVAIDRAAFMNGEWEINVGFADAHVEMLELYRLEELLEMPLNEGAREELQLGDF